ncbi:MAG TPA: phage major capsid protein [Candidatus Limnocylindrales bacterium]|nr:phage major capsid protein [Candidatus Limnocylindrales bacterium]
MKSITELLEEIASVAREQHAAYGDPVVRYLDAKPERRFFWNAVARLLGGGFRADSPEAKVWQRAVSGINLQDTFGPGLLESMPVADEIWNLILQFGQYKYLGLRKMIGAYTRYAQVTQYPNAIFITPSGQGQTTIPEDTSLLGSALTPLANTIACLITCSLAWLQDEKVDLSEVLLSKFVQGLAARIDYGCFQGNGQDDQTNGMCTGLFVDPTIPAYVAPAGEPTIAGLQRNDFINTIAQVAPAALQRMDSQPPRWFISPVLIPQLLLLWDGTAKNYLLKTPAETRGEWLLVGFPVTFCAQAPSVNAANAKVAVFGNGDAMLVALQEKFEIAKSDKGAAFGSANVSFRATGRGRNSLRVANGFASLKLAAG